MALTGLDIFKLMPKTNCGDCGVPTCLAFAMKLAQGQAELESCPHVSDDAKAALGEASAPPMRAVTVGVGDDAFTVGEETVLFRHEKTFVNPCAIGVEVGS
ncbi:MAG: acetyl-CoA decarbonylase/synthase complex subunit gamma, partial [Actinomycetota bacterium]|nr:acetyl-CoA decarbonylase/synthase complex subunit gamma [Actinomycetota bacterium]